MAMVATVTRLKAAATTVHYFEADGCYARNNPEHRKASGWYEMASDGDSADDPSATKFGINVGIDEISVGGSMYDVDGGATQFDAGVSWTQGSMELGLQFANNDNAADPDVSKTAAHLTYTLGPGILIGGTSGQHFDRRHG